MKHAAASVRKIIKKQGQTAGKPSALFLFQKNLKNIKKTLDFLFV